MSAQPTILLVEDDPATLAATKRLLERAHLRCETAATGSDGLQLARALRPHLVLLDLALPDGSGTEVLRQIRADPDLESVSVVFLTSAKTPPDTRSPGVEGGADGFISRPVSNADLLAQVQMHLGQWEQKEKLRASQARFRNLITDLPDALLVVNQAAVIQFANPAAAVLLERPAAELCGSTFGFPLAATGGTEIEVPLPGQGVRVAAMRVLPTTWDGEPAWLACLRDLTEQKRLQAALAAQADFTQRVFDSTDAHQAVVGPDGRILAVNEAWRRFARLNHAGSENTWGVGASYFRACRPETGETSLAAEAYEGVRRVQQNLLPSFELEYPCHAPNEQRWFLLRAVPLLRQPGAVLVSHTNVTARRRAEAEARRNQERFSALFQNAPLYSVLWRLIRDRQGEIVDWEVAAINKPGAASIGLTPEAAVGRRAVEMFGAEVMAPYLQFSREDAKSGQTRQHETYFATNGRHYLSSNFLIGPDLYANIGVDITERKQAEAALGESEARLRLSVAAANVGLWDWDLATNQVFYSAEWKRQIGYRDEEIPNRFEEWQSRVHPDDLEPTLGKIRSFLAQTQGAHQVEFRFRHKDGSYRWIYTHADVLRDAAGKPVRMLGSHLDITERKQTEAALSESEARFRTLVEQAPEGIFIQTQRRFAYVNAAMVRLLGAAGPEEILGQPVESRIHPDFRSVVRERIRGLNEERLPQPPMDQVFLRLDGSPRDVTVSAVPFEFDREPGALVFVRDITERKRAQDAEQQSEARRALALKAAQAGTWEWDLATNRNTWSEELWELYGLEPHSCEPTYETWKQTLHPEDCERVERESQRCVQQEAEISLEWRVKNAGQRARWLLSRGRPLRDAAGRVVRYVGVVLDITERKRAEAEAAVREAVRLVFREAGSLESAYVKLAELLASHLGFTVGVVALHDAARDEIVMTGSRSDGTELPRVLRVPASQTFSSVIVRTGDALVETHISTRPEYHHEAIHKLGLETFIGVPLHGSNRVIGALVLADHASREDASLWVAALQNIAHTVSVEIARQHALDSLTVSEARQRAILDNIPDPAWLKDGEGQFLAVNKPWCDFVGVTAEQAVGHRDTELFPPEVARKFREEEQQLVAAGQSVMVTESLPDASGQPRWFESHKTPLFDAEGRLSAHIGIARDITERMRNEQERARLFAAIEHSGEAIVITDSQCRIQYVNAAFEQNTGYTKAEALGQNPRFLKSGQHDAAFYRSIWNGLKQDGVWRGRFTNRHKQGRLFYEDATITAVVDADGQVLTYIAVKRDVTRAVQMEEQLRQAQKLEAIGQLAGGVAHDFNNILSAVMMQAGLVQMAPGLDEDARNALLEVGRTAQRGAAFTRRLLLFSRRTTPTLQALDLNELVANLLKMLRRLVPEDVSLDFQPTPGLPTVAADGGMMDQVIMNLVLNARDAMPQGGGITLRSQLLVFEALDCAADPNRRPGAFVCLTVADTGCGMDAATLKRIFEPFFTTKEAGKGTGLGLATVHGIVAQHHGWVEVESAVGHGTTFRVYLPAKAEPTTAVSGKAADEEAPRGTGTLLLVEDEEGLRQSLTRTLQRLGYQVHVAQSGEEAMRLWPAVGAEVALVLTDMVMPGTISGWDLALTLQGLKPGLPVILSTGYTDRIDTRLGLPPGMVLLPKPYGVATLARLLRDCLHGPSALPGEAPSAAPAKPVRSLSREWVSTLPDDLRGQFVVAAERAYHDTLQALCDRVATLDAELGARLHELVKAFDYTALLELFLPGKK